MVSRFLDALVWLRWLLKCPPLPPPIHALREVALRLSGLVDVCLFSKAFFKGKERNKNDNHHSGSILPSQQPSGHQDVSLSQWSWSWGQADKKLSMMARDESSWCSKDASGEEAALEMGMVRGGGRKKGHALQLKMFCSTWNMGGRSAQGLDEVVAKWIPSMGYSMYVVAVQECTCLKQVRAVIHDHLGKSHDTIKKGQHPRRQT